MFPWTGLWISENKNIVDPHTIAVQPKRPKAYRDVEGELSTFVRDTTVTVKPDGTVTLIKHKKKKKQNEKITKEETEDWDDTEILLLLCNLKFCKMK